MSLHRYEIRYTDASDPGCPEFVWTCKAYSAEHAEMKFYESDDDDGWKILDVKRAKKRD